MTVSPPPTDTDRLAEIEAAVAKATPGPWQVDSDGEDLAVTAGTARGLPGSWRTTDRIYTVDVGEWSGETEDEAELRSADAALIVAAVNSLPWLLATVREQADAIGRARALADEWVARMDTYLVGLSLRAVLPADHEQNAGEEERRG